MMGFVYIIVQFVGLFVGQLLNWMFTKQAKAIYVKNDWILAALLPELVGTYLFIICFLIQNEKSTLIS